MKRTTRRQSRARRPITIRVHGYNHHGAEYSRPVTIQSGPTAADLIDATVRALAVPKQFREQVKACVIVVVGNDSTLSGQLQATWRDDEGRRIRSAVAPALRSLARARAQNLIAPADLASMFTKANVFTSPDDEVIRDLAERSEAERQEAELVAKFRSLKPRHRTYLLRAFEIGPAIALVDHRRAAQLAPAAGVR